MPWLLGIGLAGLVVAVSQNQDAPLSFEALKTHQAALSAYRLDHPGLTALLYFALYVTVTGLSVPGVIVLSMAGGALFGLIWGTVLASFGFTIGGLLAFLMARRFLRDAARRRWGARLAAIEAGMARDGPLYLFGLRLVPVIPYFLVNLLMGLTKIPVRTFYWVSQLGMLPLLVVYVNAGTQLARLDSPHDLLSPTLLLSLGALAVLPLLARWMSSLVLSGREGSGRPSARWSKPSARRGRMTREKR
ncbi:MAG: TVP38/TMEM64 family protein [Candidatus Competibacter sp.]|nr:TVP38/TMEM64 family protein [Candidatus Competibacter sp.]